MNNPTVTLDGTTEWTASVEKKPFADSSGHWYVVLDADENGIGEFYGDDHEANVANLKLAASAPDLARSCIAQAETIAELREALEPFALLADGANMHDPLSKWFTVAQLKDAAAALNKQAEGLGDE